MSLDESEDEDDKPESVQIDAGESELDSSFLCVLILFLSFGARFEAGKRS